MMSRALTIAVAVALCAVAVWGVSRPDAQLLVLPVPWAVGIVAAAWALRRLRPALRRTWTVLCAASGLTALAAWGYWLITASQDPYALEPSWVGAAAQCSGAASLALLLVGLASAVSAAAPRLRAPQSHSTPH